MMATTVVSRARRIVVKVGSSLVTDEGRGLDIAAIQRWGAQIAQLRERGLEVLMVSSGAIAEGMKRLGWTRRPHEVHDLQAAAAVGQMGLVQVYETVFREHGLGTAQVLLTHEDLADRNRYLNARATLTTLLGLGVIPIINENDTVVTDEIKFGDNDTLGALVASLVDADLLVILTDQAGLYTADPRRDPNATLVSRGVAGDPAIAAMAGGVGSGIGKGGMLTKILAAQRAALSGASTVICSGRESDVLVRLAMGEAIGTELVAELPRLAARKQWMAGHLQLKGQLVLDPGAIRALRDENKSLLPVGVANVVGEFVRGDVVACVDTQGREVARGLVNYSATDSRRIAGRTSGEIESILGYVESPELIHRDNMVVAQD
jgi:glutamate 5-kinase